MFKPSMQGAIINNAKSEQSKQQVINAYDNTIAYTDYIMYLTIKELKQSEQNTLFFYFSDHGNQLFDNKMTPHGMPYKIAKERYHDVINPGAFIWFSKAWLSNINNAALKNASKYKRVPFSYNGIFSSVLDCAGVSSKYINKKLSLCRNN